MRKCSLKRETSETKIELELFIDGKGKSKIDTGIGFLDHMLTLFSKHSGFDLSVKCDGDLNVDFHHTTEDIGITLGKAFLECLGDFKGIARYGSVIIPMDEALALCSVDIGGRAFVNCDLNIPTEKVGDFDAELVNEFMTAFANNAKINLHIKQLEGANSHHIIECAFKALGRALRAAVLIDDKNKDEIPSTKGTI